VSRQPPVCTSRVVQSLARPSRAGAKQRAEHRQPVHETARARADGTRCCPQHMRTPRTEVPIQLRRRTDCSFSTACSPAAKSATHHRSGTPVRQGAHLLLLFARRALAREARLAGLSLPHLARAAARADSLRGTGPGECASRVNQRSLFCGTQHSDWSSGPRLSGVQLPRRRLLQLTGQLVARSTIKLAAALLFSCSPCSSWATCLGKAALPRPARACAVGSAVVRLTFLYGHARSLSLDTAGLPLTPAVQAWMPSCSSTWCMSGKQRTWPAP